MAALFWIAVLLLVSILYMLYDDRIREVLDNTGFVEVVFEDQTPEGVSRRSGQEGGDGQERPAEAPPPEQQTPDDDSRMVEMPRAEEPATPEMDTDDGSNEQEPDEEEIQTEDVVQVVQPPEQQPEQPPVQLVDTTLYFIRVTDDGMILPEAVQRRIPQSESPLTETIQALFDGPSTEDLNRGLLSLLPPEAQLLSARVENGVAYLNFNEQFRFNSMGVEGLVAQLQQVVYTTTQFSSVSQVQILIEGETLEYLGPEGVFIGRPLDRKSFRS